MGATSDFVLQLSNGAGARKLAAWTTGERHAITFGEELKNVRSVSTIHGDGHAGAAKLEQGQLSLTLGAMPQYVTLKP